VYPLYNYNRLTKREREPYTYLEEENQGLKKGRAKA
jgi:hypothetical protein